MGGRRCGRRATAAPRRRTSARCAPVAHGQCARPGCRRPRRSAGGWSAAPSARRPPGGCRRAAAACPAHPRPGSRRAADASSESSSPCRALRQHAAAVRPRGRGPIGPPPPTPARGSRRAEAGRAGARSRRRRPPVRARHDSTTYPRQFPAAVRGTISGMDDETVERVRAVVLAIPPGQTSAATARSRPRPGCRPARLVGRILAEDGHDLPWHRVLRADGTCAPHIAAEQAARLRAEGVLDRTAASRRELRPRRRDRGLALSKRRLAPALRDEPDAVDRGVLARRAGRVPPD